MKKKYKKRALRLLVLRPDNIGDFVLFSGAFKHLRRLYPDAHLTLAVQPHVLNLAERCPYVDECLSVDQLSSYRKLDFVGARFVDPIWRKIVRILMHRRKKFDRILYPLKSPQVAHLELIKLLNVKDVTGVVGCDLNILKASQPFKIDLNEFYSQYLDVSRADRWRHEILTTIDFMNMLGCQVQSIEELSPEFWLSDDDINPLEGFGEPGRKVIGLFPGASSEKRQWRTDNFVRLAGLVDVPVDYAIFGNTSDIPLAKEIEPTIQEASGARVLNLAGKTSLRELVKGIQSCDLFIGMETSGLHIAIASGIRSIGIVGGGHYDRFIPWGDDERNKIMTKRLDCFHCDWSCKYEQIECLQGVTPDEVAEVSNRLLR